MVTTGVDPRGLASSPALGTFPQVFPYKEKMPALVGGDKAKKCIATSPPTMAGI